MPDTHEPDPGSHPPPHSHPFIVGLGASAGGIPVLREFFARVQPGGGAAFVVILHLSPSHDSRLAEVLQTSAALPVMQVTGETRIEADCVYVIPPNRLLEIVDGTLVLREFTRADQRRSPVDVFFRALADSQGSRSVCAVLSGTGHNGSAGLKRVKEYGGLAIAQDPAEAEYGEMPQNAIATGLVDLVLRVEEMPARIRAYHDRLCRRGEPASSGPVADAGRDHDVLREILTLVRVRTGHDFSHYKPGTLNRRIERRLHLRELPSAAAYARTIRESPDEAVALVKELLISVTSFFRDPPAFKALSVRGIPRIFLDKRQGDQVRAWVPGCATGEEAYSLAMLLAEFAATRTDSPIIQVFATDLDEAAIATARDGLYSEADVADVPLDRLQRFFQREAGGYRVRSGLREMVLFAHHNVIKDPPFSRLDLISCRNLLIYLNRSVQERVLETFHFALRPGGYLLLGGAESPEDVTNLFASVDKAAHLYEVRSVMPRRAIPAGSVDVSVPAPTTRLPETRAERLSAGELHQRLLEQYGPPSLVVTEEHVLMHMSDRVGRYLQVPGGEPTRELFRLILPELRPSLRVALQEAVLGGTPVEVNAVPVTLEDRVRAVNISVRPVLRQGDPARGFFLVAFSEEDVREEGVPVQVLGPAEPVASRLEEEVARLQMQLRSTIEQYETQAEEAKAANEELQALNEELRSAAEELETSKEELQSVNEELTTVNQELRIKIEELGQANNDHQNLINSTDLGTIFLDRSLRVQMSTPSAREVFNLREGDTGRPLADITSQLRYQGLHDDIQQVIEKLHTTDREVQTRDGRWYLMRLRPYRTTEDRVEGVVITFQDITERCRSELHVRQSEERLRLLMDAVVDYAMFTMALDGVIDSWNAGAERMFGYTADEVVGRQVGILYTPEDRVAGIPDEELARARRNGRASDERVHVRKNGSALHCTGVTAVLQAGGEVVGFAKIARDLSEFKSASAAVSGARAELEAIIRDRTGELKAEVHHHAAGQTRVLRLLRRIVTAQEDERARIARDLHDQLGQQLTALRLTLEQHRNQLAVEGSVPPEVERALALTQGIDQEVDFLAWELRPAVLDDLGLAAALPKFVREWSAHYGVTAEYREHGFETGQVSRETEVVFYRVTQEALNNVVKHAHASRVDVILEIRNATLMLVIEDDGVGFDSADPQLRERGLGLVGMRERAEAVGGSLQVESAPGEGTSLFLRCSVNAAAEGEAV